MIQILHTADVHLGKKFSGFGPFGRKLRHQVRETFTRAVRHAPGQMQLVLVAGDLFDSNDPDPVEVRHLLGVIKQIEPLPVCILPGTHDRLSSDSVYHRPEFRERPKNLYLFDQEGSQTFYFPESRTAVHGRANLTNRGGEPPLKDVHPHPDAVFNVAVAHASVPLPQFSADPDDDYWVRPEELQASGMNYVAMGHWHRFAECFSGPAARAFYSGSPEIIGFDGPEAVGCWARVRLGDDAVTITPEFIGHYIWRDLEIELDGHSDDGPVRQTLEQYAGASTVCRMRLTGRPASGYRLPVEALVEDFESGYAHLQIRDETDQDVAWEKLAGRFTPNSVGDLFVRMATRKIEAAATELERTHWREVLRRGSALLLGDEQI